jgi:hypothetical protein
LITGLFETSKKQVLAMNNPWLEKAVSLIEQKGSFSGQEDGIYSADSDERLAAGSNLPFYYVLTTYNTRPFEQGELTV